MDGVADTSSGYVLVAADGGVFTFGEAQFAGSLANARLAAPIVGIESWGPEGYYLFARDGGVFTMRNPKFAPTLPFPGSLPAQDRTATVAAMFIDVWGEWPPDD